jgi:hypothetical protein
VTLRRLFAVLTTLVLGLTACGGSGGGGSNAKRVAFVEVSSAPSGQPVEIQLNNTKIDVTTPDTRNVTYAPLCGQLGTDPHHLVDTCTIIASTNFKLASGSGSLTLCVTDGGTRQCGTSDKGFVVVTVNFKP